MSAHELDFTNCSWRAWPGMLLFFLLLGSCGGGVDSGGTGAPATAASGPITGFGSVIVNSVHFDESSASIVDTEGTVHSRNDLRLGMTTFIKGSAVVASSKGISSTATSIVFGSDILGPVESIDLTAKSLVVLGQTVDITPTTVFESDLKGWTTVLSPGDLVEVYALFNALDLHYKATRIERKTNVTAYRLRGPVSDLDTANKVIRIGSEQISYAGVSPSDVPSTLANGRFVRVQLQTAQTSGDWIATRLQDGVRQLENLDDTRTEGLINDFISGTQFSVDGIGVDASRASVTGSTALGLGVRVAVRGTAIGGVLVASEVQTKSESDVESEGFELDGSITAIDTNLKTFVLRGVTVNYSGSSVEFQDGTIADLAAGRTVEVKGTLSADGTQVQAQRIRFDP